MMSKLPRTFHLLLLLSQFHNVDPHFGQDALSHLSLSDACAGKTDIATRYGKIKASGHVFNRGSWPIFYCSQCD